MASLHLLREGKGKIPNCALKALLLLKKHFVLFCLFVLKGRRMEEGKEKKRKGGREREREEIGFGLTGLCSANRLNTLLVKAGSVVLTSF